MVGPERYEAGVQALRRLSAPPDLFLLDDGFSHLALHRDLDLLAFPAADPFAGGRLPPSGRLREPLASVSRAHAALLTGAESETLGPELADALRPHGFTGSGFASFTRPGQPRKIGGGELREGARVLPGLGHRPPGAFHGERPKPRLRHRRGSCVSRTTTTIRIPTSIKSRTPPARDRVEAVLTTAKDRVKLLGRLQVPLAELPVQAQPVPVFWEWLDREITQLRK